MFFSSQDFLLSFTPWLVATGSQPEGLRHPYRSCKRNVRLESALVRLARNQVTGEKWAIYEIVEW